MGDVGGGEGVSRGQDVGTCSGSVLASAPSRSFHVKSGQVSMSMAGMSGSSSGEGLRLHAG